MYTNYSWIDLNDLFNGTSVFVSLLCRRWRRESTILKHSFEQERLVRLILISSGPQRHTNWIANHTEKHARTGEVGCPPISPREETHSSWGFIGAIVSGTWPDPDPLCITKLLEVRHSHTRAHPRGDGQPLVLLGCLPLSMLLAASPKSHDWLNQQTGWCHIATWPVHTCSLTLVWDFGKRTHFQIFTSRNVNAECHWEMRSGRLRCSGLAALFLLSDCNYLIEKSEPVENGLQSSGRNTKLLRSPQQD